MNAHEPGIFNLLDNQDAGGGIFDSRRINATDPRIIEFASREKAVGARAAEPYSLLPGTEIDGYHCEIPVEDIRPGDVVQTLDDGYQTVLWAGSRFLSCCDGVSPIHFSAGSIGNTRPITVSAHHMFMLSHHAAERLFGVNEIFVEARHLVNGDDISYVPAASVEYFQLLFECHQVILVNGIPSASLYVNSRNLRCYDPDHRREWLAALPALHDVYMNQYGPTARLVLRRGDVRMLQKLGSFQNWKGF